MKGKMLIAGGLAVALAAAPLSSAYAWRDHDHWHGGPIFWPFAAAAAIVVGAATIATLPFRAVAAVTSPGPYYAPPPAPTYYAPPPAYYPPPPQGYAPQAYYPPPQAYYPPQPRYYAPPPAYYPPPPGYAPYDPSPR
ncbi:MAG TPA: hypothetical protein VKU84_15040 [Stellaceae bacterium]|nr:hypothetical protein [Stellaceae bacterium]